jgi:hypothetical protein
MKMLLAKLAGTKAVSGRCPLWLVVLFCLVWAGPGRAQVIISEVMADNATALEFDGNYPDWVELYNAGSSSTNISGMRLTDDPLNLTKFSFPANTVMAPRSFIVVYCDNLTSAGGLHTGFGLGKKGSYLGLYDASGLYRDSVTFGLQITDFSIGRTTMTTAGAFYLTRPTPFAANQLQSLGLTNSLRINEWAATNYAVITNVLVVLDDWLEIYNPSTNPVSLAGLVLADTAATPVASSYRAITNLSFIAPLDFIDFKCNDGKGNDECSFKLSSTSGESALTLYAADRATVIHRLSFPGTGTAPNYWRGNISYGWLPDGDTNHLTRFETNRTSPGKSNFQPLTNLVVNEVLSHTDLPLEDAVEFFNPTTNAVDIGGWWLSNAKDDRKKFRIPSNSVVAPYGFKVFYEMIGSTNGFNTNGTGTGRCFTFNSAHGDPVVLTAASNDVTGTLTGYELVKSFGPAQNGISFGRYITSDGNKDFVPMSQLTFGTNVTRYDPTNRITAFRGGAGATNSYPQVGPLVVSEIHYHPPDVPFWTNNTYVLVDDSTNEFIEIFNPNSTNTPFYDPQQWYSDPGYNHGAPYASGWTNTWKIRGTVDFDFPTNVSLAPSNYLLVVNFDATNAALSNAFVQKFKVPAGVQILGPYSGKLSNKGGSIELQKPDWPQGPNHPDEFGYVPYLLVEDVQYNDTSPWPTNSDGRGFSLHRVSATGYGNDPTNWVDAVPSPGQAQILALSPATRTNGNFAFGFSAQAGLSYSVQYKGPDASGAWLNFLSYEAQPTNAWRQVTDSAMGAVTGRYYRVVSPKRQ